MRAWASHTSSRAACGSTQFACGSTWRKAGLFAFMARFSDSLPAFLTVMNTRFLILLATLGALLLAPVVQAQLQIQGGASNLLDQRRAGGFATVSEDGVVTAFTVRGGGAGYTSPPVVTVGPGSGSTAGPGEKLKTRSTGIAMLGSVT